MKCDTCRHQAAPGRKICNTCKTKNHRKKDPMRYSYDAMKANAKRRNKIFTISFEYFQQFCYQTKYHLGKGRSKVSFTVDCKINELGYAEGNIQMLTKQENSRKGVKSLEYDWETGYAIYK